MIRFLDLITGGSSIASSSYWKGLQLLLHKGRKCVVALEHDQTFLVKFLYFSKKIAKCYYRRQRAANI